MDVLVDHSGYDLMNLGDVAMLQSCVARLSRLLPSARLHVVCHDPAQLQRHCPGTSPVVLELPLSGRLPLAARRGAEFGIKAFDPVASVSRATHRLNPVGQAVLAADVVVASGGGYITDRFFWHGAGVLGTLSFAQRVGRPTAMFGQGLGPLRNPMLRVQARRVLPRLRVLGLREGVGATPVLARMGLASGSDRVQVTGDDALVLAADAGGGAGHAVGVNLRIARYTAMGTPMALEVAQTIADVADRAELVVLPVSRYASEDDLASTSAVLEASGRACTAPDVGDPRALATQVARCRVVVSTSYHAAVFALAQGVPAICLINNPYYDGKFVGLQALYGAACTMVDLRGDAWRAALRDGMRQALEAPPAVSSDAVRRTQELIASCDAMYERFAASLA